MLSYQVEATVYILSQQVEATGFINLQLFLAAHALLKVVEYHSQF